ncbi:MAG: phosphoenolpyruvate synthase, partial [Acetatifactor sp.]|nr:phosphoenolpyruvate synthase [Acetatifactor sp.]
VLLVENPTLQIDTSGKLLVAKMTDPGWVFLLAVAAGIIAEKGSLLSHTAIISRELGKPAVVGVENATRLLRNGDLVEVDGDTGQIVVLETAGRENAEL